MSEITGQCFFASQLGDQIFNIVPVKSLSSKVEVNLIAQSYVALMVLKVTFLALSLVNLSSDTHIPRIYNVEENIWLVGGTFTFKGVDSSVQYMLLSKVLRLSIYVNLSLLLQQLLLSDFRVTIKFPRPVPTLSLQSLLNRNLR